MKNTKITQRRVIVIVNLKAWAVLRTWVADALLHDTTPRSMNAGDCCPMLSGERHRVQGRLALRMEDAMGEGGVGYARACSSRTTSQGHWLFAGKTRRTRFACVCNAWYCWTDSLLGLADAWTSFLRNVLDPT